MNLLTRHILISGAFGIYCILICLLLDTFGFLSTLPEIWTYFVFTLIVSSTQLLISHLSLKIKKMAVATSISALSFVISPQFGALFLIAITKGTTFPTMYFSGILAVSLLPLCLFLLWKFFIETQPSTQTPPTPKTISTIELELSTGKGKLPFKVPIDHIAYLEANDNYVVVHYFENNEAKTSMHRCSLKSVESQLNQLSSLFLRVHKSFIINPSYVDRIEGKAQAYRLITKQTNASIPVSRNYDISALK